MRSLSIPAVTKGQRPHQTCISSTRDKSDLLQEDSKAKLVSTKQLVCQHMLFLFKVAKATGLFLIGDVQTEPMKQ